MSRVIQVTITLLPDDTLVAEHFTNGMRHHTPITTIESIRTILAAQHRQTDKTIGYDGNPTSAQIRHWEQHHQHKPKPIQDPDCTFCIADTLGVDTSHAAFLRARKLLLAERARTARKRDPSLHTVGDGTVKVRVIPKKSKHISPTPVTLEDTGLFDLAP